MRARPTGEAVSASSVCTTKLSILRTTELPEPPSVKSGRSISGSGVCSANSCAAATEEMPRLAIIGCPASSIALRNGSRASARSIASGCVPRTRHL